MHYLARINPRVLALTVALVVVVLDQTTKHIIRFFFSLGEIRPVITSFFDLTYVRNTGAVWGTLQHQNEWLVLISLAVLVLMAFFFRHFINDGGGYSAAIGCIIGGIVGNLIDRIRLGWVTDFLDFHLSGRHWPVFNVADSAICIGVACYLFASFWLALKSRPGKNKPDILPGK